MLINCHPTQDAVAFACPPDGESGLAELRKHVSPQLLRAFSADGKLRAANAAYCCSRPLLPMPLHVSPLWCAIRHDARQPWVPRVTDALTSVTLLRSVQSCFAHNTRLPYAASEEARERIAAAMERYGDAVESAETALYDEKLAPLYRAWHAGSLHDTALVHAFVDALEHYTLEFVNALERSLCEIFAPQLADIDTESLLTPRDDSVSVQRMPAALRATYAKRIAHFFAVKQTVCNTRLQRAAPQSEAPPAARIWFADCDAIASGKRLQDAPPEQRYKGWLSAATALEYARFCDVEH